MVGRCKSIDEILISWRNVMIWVWQKQKKKQKQNTARFKFKLAFTTKLFTIHCCPVLIVSFSSYSPPITFIFILRISPNTRKQQHRNKVNIGFILVDLALQHQHHNSTSTLPYRTIFSLQISSTQINSNQDLWTLLSNDKKTIEFQSPWGQYEQIITLQHFQLHFLTQSKHLFFWNPSPQHDIIK